MIEKYTHQFKVSTVVLSFMVFFLFSQSVTAVEKVLLYAAASTSSAMTEIINQFNQSTAEIKVKVSFASSSTLAKQIDAGAPAHIYISANPKWMDYLQQRKLIVNNSRQNLLKNKIVLVATKGKPLRVEMNKNFNLANVLDGKLCLGDPRHVPAGIYAKQALTTLGWWQQIKHNIVGTKDVRAALAFTEQAECSAAIVYSTDAKSSKKTRLIAEFPENSHSPVVYPAALLGLATTSASTFLKYLTSPQAIAIFDKYGFNTK